MFAQAHSVSTYDRKNIFLWCDGFNGNIASGNPVMFIDPMGLHKGDNLYGLGKAFWKWLHRPGGEINDLKGPDGQVPYDDAMKAYDEWVNAGKPGPDSKGKYRDQGGFADPGLILGLFSLGLGLLFESGGLACGDLDCDGDGLPDYEPPPEDPACPKEEEPSNSPYCYGWTDANGVHHRICTGSSI